MDEIWKDVAGFEGLYQVSNFGRVRSMDRRVRTKGNYTRKVNGVVLKNCFDGNYFHVILNNKGKGKVFLVHRIVAEAFIENRYGLPQVNHKDGNKLNNKVTNLEWCTAKDNLMHAFSTGLATPQITHYRGVKAFIAKDMSFVGEYKSQHEAARKLGLNVAHICSVLKGRAIQTCGYYFEYSKKEKLQNRDY